MKRRFLVDEYILEEEFNLNHCERKGIYKAYIPAEEVDIFVIKIENNVLDCKYFMSIIAKTNPEYRNAEFEIPYSEYRNMIGWNLYKGNIIDKIRYEVPVENNFVIYVEIYGGQLFGLVIAEIEFESEKDFELFKKPKWFNEEVTNNEEYEDKNLITINLLKK